MQQNTTIHRNSPQIVTNLLQFFGLQTDSHVITNSAAPQIVANLRNSPQFTAIHCKLPQIAVFLWCRTVAPINCLLKEIFGQNGGQPFHWLLSPKKQLFLVSSRIGFCIFLYLELIAPIKSPNPKFTHANRETTFVPLKKDHVLLSVLGNRSTGIHRPLAHHLCFISAMHF